MPGPSSRLPVQAGAPTRPVPCTPLCIPWSPNSLLMGPQAQSLTPKIFLLTGLSRGNQSRGVIILLAVILLVLSIPGGRQRSPLLQLPAEGQGKTCRHPKTNRAGATHPRAPWVRCHSSLEQSHGLGKLCVGWGTPEPRHRAAAALVPECQMCNPSLAGRKGKRNGLSDGGKDRRCLDDMTKEGRGRLFAQPWGA